MRPEDCGLTEVTKQTWLLRLHAGILEIDCGGPGESTHFEALVAYHRANIGGLRRIWKLSAFVLLWRNEYVPELVKRISPKAPQTLDRLLTLCTELSEVVTGTSTELMFQTSTKAIIGEILERLCELDLEYRMSALKTVEKHIREVQWLKDLSVERVNELVAQIVLLQRPSEK